MPKSYPNPSTAQYISAIEENLFAWIDVLGRMGQAFFDKPPGLTRSITDIPFSLFNSVMDARLAPEEVKKAIDIVQADGKAHNVPVLWWLTPSTRPADLATYLLNSGFKIDDASPGMAVDLDEIVDYSPGPAGLSIRLAEDEAAWKEWSQIMGWGFSDSPPSELFIQTWTRLLQITAPEILQAYTGWFEGKPVATSLLFLGAGVAGIYCVATIPDARRKGIGAAMTWYPLIQSRKKGIRIGALQSSEMGLRVYQSLGFKKYCDVDSYLWRPG